MVLWESDTIRIMREVDKLRDSGIKCWYSMDTGPSVFVNTLKRLVHTVAERFVEIGFPNAIISEVGGKPKLIDSYLF